MNKGSLKKQEQSLLNPKTGEMTSGWLLLVVKVIWQKVTEL